MSYDEERSDHWATYDRVVTAAADMRFLMFEMRTGTHALGSAVFARRIGDILDCVADNVKRMGAIALSFAMTVMEQSTDPVAAPILERVRALMSKGNVNGAWNLVEAWTCGRALPAADGASAPEEVV